MVKLLPTVFLLSSCLSSNVEATITVCLRIDSSSLVLPRVSSQSSECFTGLPLLG